LLKIFGKKTRDWMKNCNNISQQVVLTMISYPRPPPNLRKF
jgi:hypothetical protein